MNAKSERHRTLKKLTCCVAAALTAFAIAVVFIPVLGSVAFAGEKFDSGQKVQNLTRVSAAYSSVKIQWSAQAGAKGYQIYRAKSAKGRFYRIKTTKANSYKNSGLSMKYHYYYKVRAYSRKNGKIVRGKFSSILKTSPQLNAPSVAVSALSSGVKLSWTKVAGTTKYQVFVSESIDGKYVKTASTGSRNCTYAVPDKGKMYYFKVRSYRKINGRCYYGRYSAAMQGRTVPDAPAGLKAVAAGSSSISLQWESVPGAKYYEVYRYSASGDKYTCNSYYSSFTDSGLDPGTTYYYKVRACADMNGTTIKSAFAGGETREKVLAKALSWFGLMEYDKSNQPIIDIYNKYFYETYGTHTGYDYTIPWCAIYVSAVILETGTEDLIPIHEDCPDMMEMFGENVVLQPEAKSYTPSPADVVFYDWIGDNGKRNGRADHVGFIVSARNTDNGKEITAVEGNKTITLENGEETDAVAYRVFKPDFDSLLAYGLPQYTETKATTSGLEMQQIQDAASVTENPVPDEVVDAAVNNVENALESSENSKKETAAEKAAKDTDKVQALLECIEEENPAENSDVEESTYNAYLVMSACNQMGIDACAVINRDNRGTEISWAEVTLGGKTVKIKDSDIIR